MTLPMAALNDLKFYGASVSQADAAKFLGPFFWLWFDGHLDDVVVTINVWFIRKTVRVRDVRPLFVLLFGERPVAS